MLEGAKAAVGGSWRAILICLFVTIGAFQFGFDSSYYSGILAMPAFLEQYGQYDPGLKEYVLSAKIESITASIINLGEFLGAISSFYIGDKLGRKKGLYVSSACVVLGVIIQTTSTNVPSLVVGRLVLGYAVGLISCFVPLYVADCAPARFRGALVSMYQNCIGYGLILGVIVDNSTKGRTDTGAFRIPMAVQLVFPLILVPGLLTFAPESPRWLVGKNKIPEAQKSLQRLHGSNTELVERELATLTACTQEEQRRGPGSWRSVFQDSVERRKAYLGFSLQALQQATGINFVTGYGIVFFIAIGIDNPFIIQLGLYLVAMPAVWFSQYSIERFGRRPLLIISGLLIVAVLFVMGGAGVATVKSTALEKTIVAMVYLFLVVFNLAWGPTVWVVTSELSTGANRGRLMSFSTGSNWFFTWLVSFTFPYLFNTDAANLGPKVGFLYGSLTLAAVVWVWFYLPETSGRSLEEIDTMFRENVPARKFKSYGVELPREDVEIVDVSNFKV